MSTLIARVTKNIATSNSRLAFETAGSGALPVWDRYLTVDGRRAYQLGNVCGTCRFLFERMEGANGTIDVGKLTGRLEAGVERLDGLLVDSLALLMPAASYHVALLRMHACAVKLVAEEDYFSA